MRGSYRGGQWGFVPSEADVKAGWKTAGDIAYSPLVGSVADLPEDCRCRDCCGFDEFYVFKNTPELGKICRDNIFSMEIARGNVFVLVNYFMRLSDPEMQPIADLFLEADGMDES